MFTVYSYPHGFSNSTPFFFCMIFTNHAIVDGRDAAHNRSIEKREAFFAARVGCRREARNAAKGCETGDEMDTRVEGSCRHGGGDGCRGLG